MSQHSSFHFINESVFFSSSEIRECASNPCQNSATCDDLINGYQCICMGGYEGVNCEIGKAKWCHVNIAMQLKAHCHTFKVPVPYACSCILIDLLILGLISTGRYRLKGC